jgi:acyl-CoA reductase-like NAD-dependent aldehyde dehydrogenase
MQKVFGAMDQIEPVLGGLTRGLDLSILDTGFGEEHGRALSFYAVGKSFGAVLPSNSPGVHTLWIPAFALKYPLALKPGRDEPWTPYRVIQALIKAGAPAEAFCYLPCDHAGAGEILRRTSRSMLFGDAATTRPWAGDPRVQLHGPGWSKVVFGNDEAPNWRKHLDVMVTSIAANGGRSCINASGVWTPSHSREIADALAKKLAQIKALSPDHPDAALAAFTNPKAAESFSAMIDEGLKTAGAEDMTARHRGSGRVAAIGKSACLLPTVIWCESPDHPLANREFLFPFASVVACPQETMVERMGPTLVATAITKDQRFIQSLMASPHVDRLNIGPIPTPHIAWNQPHEGNLFEHLYRQRAFQQADA